ncbi:hypothetical protein R1sor_015717 [Riccia sorocarpa]|uniref:Uncharacterized protein n=1 Tax=Riccia sorocarpa TaxID=122646 RepID=A0ABD3HDD7_9MARC
MGKWIPELTRLGYDEKLPVPINKAIQVTMAAIPSKAVHSLVQQLDTAAVLANKEIDDTNTDGDGYAALLLESLGIDNWITVLYTFKTLGEEATLNQIRQLHEDLPTLLETDMEEEARGGELAIMIGKTLSWIDQDRNVLPGEVEIQPEVPTVDVPAQDPKFAEEEAKTCGPVKSQLSTYSFRAERTGKRKSTSTFEEPSDTTIRSLEQQIDR